MSDGELDEMRVRKLQERFAEAQQAQQADQQKKVVLKHLLTPEAYERMMNVKISNPALYEQVVGMLAYLYQSKQLKGKVGEEQIVALLSRLTQKKETSIQIKRKGD